MATFTSDEFAEADLAQMRAELSGTIAVHGAAIVNLQNHQVLGSARQDGADMRLDSAEARLDALETP